MLGTHVAQVMSSPDSGFELRLHEGERFDSSTDLYRYLDAIQPGSVLNCIGHTGTDAADHFRVNGCLPRVIADWCDQHKALFIHISTNAVFPPDSKRYWYPDDQPDPRTPYEVSKRYGEDPRAYVIRVSFIGQSPKGVGLLHNLSVGRPYRNRLWNGVTALTLARRMKELTLLSWGIPLRGCEHLHSPSPVTIRQLAAWVGSSSVCEGEARDSRLLAGGPPVPDFHAQLEEYLKY